MSDEDDFVRKFNIEAGLRNPQEDVYDPEADLLDKKPAELADSIVDLGMHQGSRPEHEIEGLIKTRLFKIAERYDRKALAQVIQQLDRDTPGTVAQRRCNDAADIRIRHGLQNFVSKWQPAAPEENKK